ncbi:ribonuclease HII [Chitinivibrio alkaliphilus]|uniref:Ribonuclease HII n=1 Tax=Chitinivibrio alkaliphilus ACht1 TaxID=1313304 RepID=U7D5B7_9BACT|nr:ribonuclease HII [Chitinivibrio alkaliphilus]ERP31143.1 Ribonuclease HII [Chitinivibrio alkaliphilus ACht1]
MNRYEFDAAYEHGGAPIGTDEAGRGPLAGPVVAAAVQLNMNDPIDELRDSKKLREKKREVLFTQICSRATAFGIATVCAAEIDRINILQASLQAMARAVSKITPTPKIVLIDGIHPIPDLCAEQQHPLVKGDDRSACIAAASIVAKVIRDRIMRGYHTRWPQYEFASHKGYPTRRHKELLRQYGPVQIHRKSFAMDIPKKNPQQLSFL